MSMPGPNQGEVFFFGCRATRQAHPKLQDVVRVIPVIVDHCVGVGVGLELANLLGPGTC